MELFDIIEDRKDGVFYEKRFYGTRTSKKRQTSRL